MEIAVANDKEMGLEMEDAQEQMPEISKVMDLEKVLVGHEGIL